LQLLAALLHLHSFPTRRSSDLGPAKRDDCADDLSDKLAWIAIKQAFDNRATVVHRPIREQAYRDLAEHATYAVYGNGTNRVVGRSEEHTSALQSRFDLVCRLLL